MPSTDWIADLKVADLKEELKKRGQPTTGKKAELAARLEAYVTEHEGSGAPAEEEPTAEDAPAPAAAPEEPAPAAEAAKPEPAAPAHAPEGADVDLDYGDSDEDGPAPAPAAAPASKKKESPAATKKKESAPKTEAPKAAPKEEEKEKKEKRGERAPRGGAAGIFGAAMASIKPSDDSSEPSNKKRPAPEPSAAAPASAAAADAADAPRPPKQAKPDRPAEQKPQDDTPMKEASGDGPPPPSRAPTRALVIDGFVRPFTLTAAKDLLSRSGTVVEFWMPNIKNMCWAVFASKAEAAAAREAVWRLRWPDTSPKTLTPRYASLTAAEKAIGEVQGNPEFKIARVEEDGPEDEEGGVEGGAPAAGRDRSARKERESAKKEEKKVEEVPEQAPLGVKDLRELIQARRPSVGGGVAAEAAAATLPRAPPAPGVSVERLNELFRRTDAKPAVYWLPLSEEAVAARRRAAAAVRGGRR